MRVVIILGIVLLCFTSVVGAGEKKTADNNLLFLMTSQLNLAPDQVAKLKPLLERYGVQRQDLIESFRKGAQSKDELRTKLQYLQDDENEDLQEILTPDQMSQWQNLLNHLRHGSYH